VWRVGVVVVASDS